MIIIYLHLKHTLCDRFLQILECGWANAIFLSPNIIYGMLYVIETCVSYYFISFHTCNLAMHWHCKFIHAELTALAMFSDWLVSCLNFPFIFCLFNITAFCFHLSDISKHPKTTIYVHSIFQKPATRGESDLFLLQNRDLKMSIAWYSYNWLQTFQYTKWDWLHFTFFAPKLL